MINAFVSNNPTIVHESKVLKVHMRSQFDHTKYVIGAMTIQIMCQDIAAITAGNDLLQKMREGKKIITGG